MGRINTNVDALVAQQHLSMVSNDFSSAVAKLSSGLRINSAADDAAGLAISQKLHTQINGFDQGGRNAQDAISMVQTGEGALGTTQAMLQRMRELAVQAANDSYTASDRVNIQAEINQLVQEIDRIAQQTDFNTKKLLDGSAGAAQVAGGGPDVKGIVAQAQVALSATFGIVGQFGSNLTTNPPTYQAVQAAAGATTSNSVFSGAAGGVLSITAGDGNTWTFTMAKNDQSFTVSGPNFTNQVNGTGAGGAVSVQDLLNAINTLPSKPLRADLGQAAANKFTVNDTTPGYNPPQLLTMTATSDWQSIAALTLNAGTQGNSGADGTGFAAGAGTANANPTVQGVESVQAIQWGTGGNTAAAVYQGPGSMTIAAGDGTNYTFTITGATGNTLMVTGQGGRNNGFSTTILGSGGAGNQVTLGQIIKTINGLSGTPLNAVLNTVANTLTLTDTVAGMQTPQNPAGPQALTVNATGSFANAPAGTAAVNFGAGQSLGSAQPDASGFAAGGTATAVTYTQNATRSAVESRNISSGSVFTQLSSITIQGGLGTQTFTAQAGESMETFFQQVNGAGLGVTMAIDQGTGKMLIYNNNYGVFDAKANASGVKAVAVSAATGDFGGGTTQTALTGSALNLGFDAADQNSSVNSQLKFLDGTKAVNAVVTLVDPANITTSSPFGYGYTTVTAQGQNSDIINGTNGLSGMVITLATPGNVQGGDSFTVKENAALNFQVGANANQTVQLQIDAATSQALGVTSMSVLTAADAETAITQLDRAIQSISQTRASMGAVINRLNNSVTNDSNAGVNASAANSRIEDVDVAKETVNFTRDQILLQAGTAVLAQANQAPTSVLSLLR